MIFILYIVLSICMQSCNAKIEACFLNDDWQNVRWYALQIRFSGLENPAEYELYSAIEVDRWWGYKHFGIDVDENGYIYGSYNSRWYKNDIYASRLALWLVPKNIVPTFNSFGFEPNRQTISESIYFRIFNRDIIEYGNFTFSKKAFDKYSYHDPNNNQWTDDRSVIYADSDGFHLQIQRKQYLDQTVYWSTEIKANQALGYGSYFWTTNSRIDLLHKDAVLGLFIYDYFGATYHSEIDFEIAKWGNDSDITNTQIVVQPWSVDGNLHRFTVPNLEGYNPDYHCTFGFYFHPKYIHFVAYIGSFETVISQNATLIFEYNYTEIWIPPPNDAVCRMNLWISSKNRTISQDQHVVVSDFRFCNGDWQTNQTECSSKSTWRDQIFDDAQCPTPDPTSDPTMEPTMPTMSPTYYRNWKEFEGITCYNLGNSYDEENDLTSFECFSKCWNSDECAGAVWYEYVKPELHDISRCYLFDGHCFGVIEHDKSVITAFWDYTDYNYSLDCIDYPMDWKDKYNDDCTKHSESGWCEDLFDSNSLILNYADSTYNLNALGVCCECNGGLYIFEDKLLFESIWKSSDNDNINSLITCNTFNDGSLDHLIDGALQKHKWDSNQLLNICNFFQKELYEQYRIIYSLSDKINDTLQSIDFIKLMDLSCFEALYLYEVIICDATNNNYWAFMINFNLRKMFINANYINVAYFGTWYKYKEDYCDITPMFNTSNTDNLMAMLLCDITNDQDKSANMFLTLYATLIIISCVLATF